MGQADKNVRVHDGASDFCFLQNFPAADGNGDVVGAFESIADQNRTTGRQRRETIFPGALQMFERVFTAAHVQGVAVGQKGFATHFFDDVDDGLGIIRTQEAEVAQLTEMHFDGDKLALHIDLAHTRGADQFLQFDRQPVAKGNGAKV